MLELKDKKILLFIPNFFGYELDIKNELESLGAKVFYFDARPKNDFITKVFIRLNLKIDDKVYILIKASDLSILKVLND